MADNVIDSLSIEIGSNVKGASNGIRRLKKTLSDLRELYKSVDSVTGSVAGKLRDLANGINALAGIDAERLKSSQRAIKQLAKADFSALSASFQGIDPNVATNMSNLANAVNEFAQIPTDISGSIKTLKQISNVDFSRFSAGLASIPDDIVDKIIYIADGVTELTTRIDARSVTRSIGALTRLREFDFQGLSMNIDSIDPSVADKVRTLMESFSAISNDFSLTSNLEQMRLLFSADFSGFSRSIDDITASMPGFVAAISQLVAACSTPDFARAVNNLYTLSYVDASGFSRPAASARNAVPNISEEVEREEDETRSAWQRFKDFLRTEVSGRGLDVIRTGLSSLGGIGKAALSVLESSFARLKTRIDKSTIGANKFIRSVGRIALYRSIRFMFSQIAAGLREGTVNLYQYSKAIDGRFAKSMDMIATSILYFRNSVAAASAPIINSLAPAIDLLVDRLVEALNYFNQLSAKLTGATTWTKALKYPKEYAKATNDASKALKDFQMGFDELNVISDNSASQIADTLDYSKMFTEVEVDTDFEPWVDAFIKAIESSDFYGAGKILGERIKEMFASLPYEEWGKSLADKINKAVAFANGFLETKPFDELGAGIAKFANAIFEDVDFYEVGKMFANLQNALWSGMYELVHNLNFDAIGVALADSFNGFVENLDTVTIGKTINEGLNGILSATATFLEEFDGYQLGKKVADGFNQLNVGEILSNAGHIIKFGLDDILDAINGFLENTDWQKLGGDLFKGLSDFIFGNDWGETGGKIVKALANIGLAIRDFVSGFAGEIVLNLFDDEQLENWTIGAEAITGTIDDIKQSFSDFSDTLQKDGGFWGFFEGVGEYIYDELHPASAAVDEVAAETFKAKNKLAPAVAVVIGTFTEFRDNWKVTVDDVKEKTKNLGNYFGEKFAEIKNSVIDNVGGMALTILSKMQEISSSTSEKLGMLKGSWAVGFDDIKKTASNKMDEMLMLIVEWDGFEKFKGKWQSTVDEVKSLSTNLGKHFGTKFGEIKSSVVENVGGMSLTILAKVQNLRSEMSEKIDLMKGSWTVGMEDIKKTADDNLDKMFTKFAEWDGMEKFKDNWTSGADEIKKSAESLKNNLANKFNEIKTNVSEKMSATAATMAEKMGNIYARTSEKLGQLKGSWAIGMEDIKRVASERLGDMFTSFSEWNGLDKFKEYWTTGIDEIKNAAISMKDSIANTLGEIPGAIISKANSIWESLEQVINGMIDVFNQFTDHMGVFSFNIPDWVPGIGGNSYSFGIPKISYVRVGRFENGGYPETGSLFYANENGVPEMVGRIGNRTAVANNDQIVEAVADGVAAVLEVYIPQIVQAIREGSDTPIQIDGKTVAKIVNRHNRESGASIFGGSVVNAT